MALWLVRAGSQGEHEERFLDDKRIYLTWDNLNIDLSRIQDGNELKTKLVETYSDDTKYRTIANWAGQIWAFAKTISIGDWVILPGKFQPVFHIGKVVGDYIFHPNNPNPYYHSREIDWFAIDIPRSVFDQDILYSLGAFLTVCRIERNNIEDRIKALSANGWKKSNKDFLIETTTVTVPTEGNEGTNGINDYKNFEELADSQLAQWLIRKYKGRGMERIIAAILKAKGFVVFQSPENKSDNGVDILASSGELGFESPRVCVQVKTTDEQVDRPTLTALIGAMTNYHAEFGILVSWNGFKRTVIDETARQFFKVRLWNQQDVIRELIENYDKLDEGLRSELPLKRIWILSLQGE